MQPSSRTPEGDDNLCPICGCEVRIEPSRPPGDAPCPSCGVLLWFATPAIDPPRVQKAAMFGARAKRAMEAGDMEGARRQLKRALALDSSNARFREMLARVEAQLAERRPRKRRRTRRQLG